MNRSGRRQIEDELHEVAFRALLALTSARLTDYSGRTNPVVGGRLYFLSVRSAGKDRDPRPLLMTRFLDLLTDGPESSDAPALPDAPGPLQVRVCKVSRARRAGGFVVERGTGRLGTILRLSRISRGRSTGAVVHAQWFSHPNARATVRLRLENEAGRWVVRDLIEKKAPERRRRTRPAPSRPGNPGPKDPA